MADLGYKSSYTAVSLAALASFLAYRITNYSAQMKMAGETSDVVDDDVVKRHFMKVTSRLINHISKACCLDALHHKACNFIQWAFAF